MVEALFFIWGELFQYGLLHSFLAEKVTFDSWPLETHGEKSPYLGLQEGEIFY